MGVKLVVFNDRDPDIGIVFEHIEPGGDRAQGWCGCCTECGRIMHRWHQDQAMADGQRHVNKHTG